MSTAREMAGLIAELVERTGLSQRQFADLVGASAKHVNLVFNGKATAHPATLDTWAEALGCQFKVGLEIMGPLFMREPHPDQISDDGQTVTVRVRRADGPEKANNTAV